MRAKDLSAALAAVLPLRRPMLVWGPPGIGKTDVITQTAKELNADILVSYPAVDDPTDAKGYPKFLEDHAVHVPFGDLYTALRSTTPLVWLLDEMGQAPPLVQAAYMHLLLTRRANGSKLPDHVMLAGASNRQEDRAGVNKMITPLLNRFIHLDMEVSVDDWLDWALMNNILPDVRAFIKFRPGLLHAFDAKSGERAFPTPRSWEMASQAASVTPEHLLQSVVAGCVGAGPTAEYIGFRQIYNQLPDPATVLANPSGVTVPTEPAVLWALTAALVERCRKANDQELNGMATFCNRVPDEFSVLGMRDMLAVSPRAVALPATKAWAQAHPDLFQDAVAA